jgi:hypothetical protein
LNLLKKREFFLFFFQARRTWSRLVQEMPVNAVKKRIFLIAALATWRGRAFRLDRAERIGLPGVVAFEHALLVVREVPQAG